MLFRTVKEASQKAGIRLATVFKWLKNPIFKAELDRLREEIISDVVDRLKVHCMKATDVLVNLMESENEVIRRGSANDILNHTHTFVEMRELAIRLDAVEKNIKERSEPWPSKDSLHVLNAI